MFGAICGDVIGSVFEAHPTKLHDFPLFQSASCYTDDTVLTAALARAILGGMDYQAALLDFGRRYPHAGYGMMFRRWLEHAEPQPYNSWGNGSAMRVSPVGFAFDDTQTVLREAEKSASVTHNHPEGIKGAQATALSIYLARSGHNKDEIRDTIKNRFRYDLDRTLDEIRTDYRFDPSCRGTVPEAIIAFLESDDFEDAVRNAVSLGGDSDTLGAITGGIAQAFYREIPPHITAETRRRLPDEFLEIIDEFERRYLAR